MAPAFGSTCWFFCSTGTTTTSSSSLALTSTSSVIHSSTIVPTATSSAVISSTSSAAPVSTLKTSNAGVYSNCYYNVDGAGMFNTRWVADWTTGATQDMTGIVSSAYAVGAASSSTSSSSSKVKRSLNSLISLFSNALSFRITPQITSSSLTSSVASAVGSTVSSVGSTVSSVTSGAAAAVQAQKDAMSSSTQLYTSYNDILYGSVRAVILLSNATGFTSFRSDTLEIDLNWLSYHTSYDTSVVSDAATAWHEYRVDWLPGTTNYYIDSNKVYSSASETSPGLWLWNAFSDGSDDSVFQIRSIDAYFNRTSVSASIANGAAVCSEVKLASAAVSSAVAGATSAVGGVVSGVGGLVGGVVGSSTSSSSATPAPTTMSTTTSTSTSTSTSTTPSTSAQATVSFTTISSAWTGKSTSTTTQLNGLAATVIVLTPGVVQTTASSTTSSSNGYVFMTTTTDSGTFSAVQTQTIFPKVGTTATVQIVYPTPVTTCGNTGIAYAGYTNYYAGGQATYGYPAFTPTVYKTAKPTQTGTTNYIAEVNGGSSNVAYYGRASTGSQNWVVDHTFYLFARQDGYYSFNIPYTDDLQMVWIGGKAVSGWTRNNADIVQFWSSQIATQTPQTIAQFLTTGTYLPLRVMWVNGGGAGELDFNIYGPDGSTILASNRGLGTGSSSIDIVRFPCDSSLGNPFPAWGSET